MPRAVYKIRAEIKGITPAIWRSLIVPNNITFQKLHKILQTAFGWQDYHLFEFEFGELLIGIPDIDFDRNRPVKSAKSTKIDNMFSIYKEFIYRYDFGENWEHVISVEAQEESEDEVNHPLCLEGARHCPLEDVGGVAGYINLINVLSNPHDPDYEQLRKWAQRGSGLRRYDPEYFNLDDVNKALSKIKCLPGKTSPKAELQSKLNSSEGDEQYNLDDFPAERKRKILESVLCFRCRHQVTVVNWTARKDKFGVLVEGYCKECGSKVARLLEGA